MSALVVKDHGVLSPMDFGASGDGTDDSAAFLGMFNANALRGGGHIKLQTGRTYRVTQDLLWNREDGPLHFEGTGALIVNESPSELLRIKSSSTAALLPRATISNLNVIGPSAGGDGLVIDSSTGTKILDCELADHPNGSLIALENRVGWCEQTIMDRNYLSADRTAIDFRPSSILGTGGQGGTESFARTRVTSTIISRGLAGFPLVDCRGGVYGSSFRDIGGNLNTGVTVFRLAGAMGGTVIDSIDYEFGGPTASILEVAGFSARPPRVANVTRHGTGPSIFATGTDPSDFDQQYLLGTLDVSGSRNGNPALQDLLNELATTGIISNSSTP